MTARVISNALPAQTRSRIIDEAFRRGWAFKVHADGAVEVTPPSQIAPRDPFELVDFGK